MEITENSPIGDLEVSMRTLRALNSWGCKTVGDVMRLTYAEMAATINFGRQSFNELGEVMQMYGFHPAWFTAPTKQLKTFDDLVLLESLISHLEKCVTIAKRIVNRSIPKSGE